MRVERKATLNKLRIIIAEDHEDMRQALVFMLKDHFEVICAVNDGRELVDAAISNQPDVIISDISMPRLSGPQAMRELRTRGYSFPFLFVSSVHEFLGQCAWSFVDKMDVSSELIQAVQSVASGRTYISNRLRQKNGSEA